MFISFILIIQIITTVVVSSNNIPRYETVDSAFDKAVQEAQNGKDIPDFVFLVDGEVFGVSELEVSGQDTFWKHYKVTEQKRIWNDWSPASCIYLNEFSPLPFTVTSKLAALPAGGFKPGFDVEFGKKVAIQKNYISGETSTNLETETRTYSVPAYSYGQIWQQQVVIRQFQQFRVCEKKSRNGIHCGEWSEQIQGDLPVDGGIIFGWRTMFDKLDLNSCGGGLKNMKE